MRLHFIRRYLGLVALTLCGACRVADDAERVSITGSLAPSSTCDYAGSNIPVSRGFYDPTVDHAAGYVLALGLQNNMQAAADNTVSMGPVQNITPASHDAKIIAAEGCWYVADGNSGVQATKRDCSTLTAQSGSFEVSAFVREGLGTGFVTLRALGRDQLKSIFGAGFEPSAIPALGAFVSPDPSENPSVAGLTQNTPTIYRYSFGPSDNISLATRDPAWGSFPAARSATVVLQLRLKVQLDSGDTFFTEYFNFPIDICPRCLQGICGELVQRTCAKGPCPDGTACLAGGTCADTSLTCSAATLMTGSKVDYSLSTCLPAQNFSTATTPTCVPVGCNGSTG